MTNLVISHLGMIASLGRSAVPICAAIRAGLSRPSPLDEFELLDPMTLEPIPLVGHRICGFSEGFALFGLWQRVARGAFDDLWNNLPHQLAQSQTFWNETALIAATPYLDGDRFMTNEAPEFETIKTAYLRPLRDMLAMPITDKNLHIVSRGHASTIGAIGLAGQLIQENRAANAIIVAVDSYLDALTLDWLASRNRLKSPDNPAGLAPGEAGVCLLVQSTKNARAGAPMVLATAEATEPANLASNEPNLGQGLAQAIRQVAERAKRTEIFTGDVISDQNGEFWRAQELACARLAVRTVVDMNTRVVIPAVSLGDTGAASGAVAICVALQSFLRSYASCGESLVVSSTERGDVAAACLHAA